MDDKMQLRFASTKGNTVTLEVKTSEKIGVIAEEAALKLYDYVCDCKKKPFCSCVSLYHIGQSMPIRKPLKLIINLYAMTSLACIHVYIQTPLGVRCDPNANDGSELCSALYTDAALKQRAELLQFPSMDAKDFSVAQRPIPMGWRNKRMVVQLFCLIKTHLYLASLLKEGPRLTTEFDHQLRARLGPQIPKSPCQQEMDDFITQMLAQLGQDTINKLTDMGYASELVKKSLLLNELSPMAAAVWLTYQKEDSPQTNPDEANATNSSNSAVNGLNLSVHDIEIIKRNLKRQEAFKASEPALENLCSMGFNKNDVLLALRLCKNNQNDACNALLGDKSLFQQQQFNINSHEDYSLDPKAASDVLPQDSEYLSKMLRIPKIVQSLDNLIVFTAFSRLVSNPDLLMFYRYHSEVGPILIQLEALAKTPIVK